ncbi:MAG: YdbH domain-containing protein, partial [Opitutaceae bacterium]
MGAPRYECAPVLSSAASICRAFIRLLVIFPLACAVRSNPGGAPWIIPPLDGSFSAEVTPLILPGAPAVRVELTARTIAPGLREIVFTVQAEGLSVEGDARLDAGAEGSWRVTKGTVDLAAWSGPAISRFAPAAAGSVGGQLRFTAAGSLRGGMVGGGAELTLEGGSYENPVKKLSIKGLAAKVQLVDLRAIRSEPAQVLTWEGGSFDSLSIGAGRVQFRLQDDAVHIEEARVAVLGGEISVARASVAVNAASYALAAQMRGAQLAELLPLLPPLLASARGQLDGRIALRSDAEGIRIESGHLALRTGETAELRFLPTPGVISGQLPPMVRQYYPGLLQLETGGIPLRAERLEVVVNAAGDEVGRTAVVSLAGGPADPTVRAPVVLDVNVRGPLDQV